MEPWDLQQKNLLPGGQCQAETVGQRSLGTHLPRETSISTSLGSGPKAGLVTESGKGLFMPWSGGSMPRPFALSLRYGALHLNSGVLSQEVRQAVAMQITSAQPWKGRCGIKGRGLCCVHPSPSVGDRPPRAGPGS